MFLNRLNTVAYSYAYRFGFNGQEKDDEVFGSTGTAINYKFRMYDSRTGRFFSVDPLSAKYPHNSTYAFSENRVIDKIELEGLETATPKQPGKPAVVNENGTTTSAQDNLTPPVVHEQTKIEDGSGVSNKFNIPTNTNNETISQYPPDGQSDVYIQMHNKQVEQQINMNKYYEFVENTQGPVGLYAAKDPVIRTASMAVFIAGTGGLGAGIGTTYLTRGIFSFSVDAIAQFGVHGNISKVDWADASLSGVFNSPGAGSLLANSFGGGFIDLYVNNSGISLESPFIGNKTYGNAFMESGVSLYFGGIGNSYSKNIGGYIGRNAKYGSYFNYGVSSGLTFGSVATSSMIKK